MRYGAEHKAETRHRVLVEAARAMRETGPHRVGVADVMARAGLTHGGFYAHFKSRDDLVAAAVGQMFFEALSELDRLARDRAPADALSAYISFYLSPAHRDSRTAGCPLPHLAADAPRLGPDARDCFAVGVERLTAVLSGLLKGLGRPDPDAEAGSLLAELVGALSLARAETDPVRSDAILARSRSSLKRRLGLE